jgi:hypothetical protein
MKEASLYAALVTSAFRMPGLEKWAGKNLVAAARVASFKRNRQPVQRGLPHWVPGGPQFRPPEAAGKQLAIHTK